MTPRAKLPATGLIGTEMRRNPHPDESPPGAWDPVSSLATAVSLEFDSFASLPAGTRARVLDRFMRLAMIEMRRKPRTDPKTASKRLLVRAAYREMPPVNGKRPTKDAAAEALAKQFHLQPETAREYLKGDD
jgi:hypothetical protein